MDDSKLYAFLRELNDDADKLAEFENDPDAAMSTAGLSSEEKEVVKSGDEAKIMGLLGSKESMAAFRVIRIRNIRIRFGV